MAKYGIRFWDRGFEGTNPVSQLATKLILRNDPDVMHGIVEQARNNTAYLPIRTDEFPNGFPVITDRLAAGQIPLFNDPNSFVAKLMGRGTPRIPRTPIQEQLYDPLRLAFHEAWPDHSKPADPAKMEQFWELCHEFKNRPSVTGEPLLSASWVQSAGRSGKSSKATEAALKYQDQIHSFRESSR